MTPQQIKDSAPDGATYYKILNNGTTIRYYTKDHNGKWGIYQDWKYPIGWKLCTIFHDPAQFKPL